MLIETKLFSIEFHFHFSCGDISSSRVQWTSETSLRINHRLINRSDNAYNNVLWSFLRRVQAKEVKNRRSRRKKKQKQERKAWTIDQFKSPLWLIFDSSPLSMPLLHHPPPHNTTSRSILRALQHKTPIPWRWRVRASLELENELESIKSLNRITMKIMLILHPTIYTRTRRMKIIFIIEILCV